MRITIGTKEVVAAGVILQNGREPIRVYTREGTVLVRPDDERDSVGAEDFEILVQNDLDNCDAYAGDLIVEGVKLEVISQVEPAGNGIFKVTYTVLKDIQ